MYVFYRRVRGRVRLAVGVRIRVRLGVRVMVGARLAYVKQ